MLFYVFLAFSSLFQPSLDDFAWEDKTDVMVVGTVHLHKDESIDIAADRRQAELIQIIDRLANHNPTLIGLECEGTEFENDLNMAYAEWQKGEHELSLNERQQLGFRLAHRVGLDELHCVDTAFPPAPNFDSYEGWDSFFEAARENGEWELIEKWIPYVEAYSAAAATFKTEATLPEIYDWLNTEDAEYSQARMVLIEIGVGIDRDWAGADWLGRFEGRNIRIFAKVRDIAKPNDRILLLFGNAHKKPLDLLFDQSPEFNVIEVPKFSK